MNNIATRSIRHTMSMSLGDYVVFELEVGRDLRDWVCRYDASCVEVVSKTLEMGRSSWRIYKLRLTAIGETVVAFDYLRQDSGEMPIKQYSTTFYVIDPLVNALVG